MSRARSWTHATTIRVHTLITRQFRHFISVSGGASASPARPPRRPPVRLQHAARRKPRSVGRAAAPALLYARADAGGGRRSAHPQPHLRLSLISSRPDSPHHPAHAPPVTQPDDSDNSSTTSSAATFQSGTSSSRHMNSLSSAILRIRNAHVAQLITRAEAVAATPVVDTDLAHPSSWNSSLYGPSSQAHAARIRGATDKVMVTGATDFDFVCTATRTSESMSWAACIINVDCASPCGASAHVARVAAAREEAAAAAAGRSALPRQPIVDESADMWSESMLDSADRVAGARMAREAEVAAPARRFAAALKSSKRKLSLSARAKRSEAAFVARLAAARRS